MLDLYHTEHFTVFGGSYLAETHHSNPKLRKPRNGLVAPLVAVLVALILGAVATTGAITATQNVRASDYYGFQAAGRMENLGVPGLRELLW